jgi:acetylornithine deacetylase/succinyl-diaminopimelate desuccinylase-like protein
VVPAFSPEQFAPTVAEEVVYGRGTSDMKSGLVTMLLGALVHRDLDGRGRIRLIYVPDEETGGANGSERLVELGLVDAKECLGAIVGEPSYPDIWYAARGAFTVRVTVHGRPAHVGLHYGGDNAFEHAHDVVAALRRYRNKVSGHRTALTIEPEAARDSIMLIGGLSEGGTNFNIVPDRFSFTVDRRPNPDEDYAAARQELLDLLAELGSEHRISVEVLQDARPALPDTDGGLTGVLQSAVQAASGRHAPLSMCPGCLETRIYSALGIPAVAYGPGPMAQMHAPDERVPITNLLEAATVYALTLGELVGHG